MAKRFVSVLSGKECKLDTINPHPYFTPLEVLRRGLA